MHHVESILMFFSEIIAGIEKYREDPLEEDMATYSSVLAWRITWTEEPGELQSIGSQRVRHY